MSQYALSLSLPPVFAEENFVVSGCNEEAYRWVMNWPHWPTNALWLYGPSGSGKSHLAHIWATRANASIYPILDGVHLRPEGMTSPWLIEQVEHLRDERSLLHTINYAREHRYSLLLTSTLPPRQLPFKLPDLTSRLLALPAVSIAAPDDEALQAAMQKQFADRQLKISPEVIAYLLSRMERSFAGITATVEQLDKEALAEKKEITVPFVKRLFGW